MPDKSSEGGFCKLVCWLIGIAAGGFLAFELVNTYGQDQVQSAVIGIVAMLLVSLVIRRLLCRGGRRNRVRNRIAEAQTRKDQGDDLQLATSKTPAGPPPVDAVDANLQARIIAAASEAVEKTKEPVADVVPEPLKAAPAKPAPKPDPDPTPVPAAAEKSAPKHTAIASEMKPSDALPAFKKPASAQVAKPGLSEIVAKPASAPDSKADPVTEPAKSEKPAPVAAKPEQPVKAPAPKPATSAAVPEPAKPASPQVDAPKAVAEKPATETKEFTKPKAEAEKPKAEAPKPAPEAAEKPKAAPAPAASAEETPDIVPMEPRGLDAPEGGKADDLTQIDGVGADQEKALNAAGIFHFQQFVGMNRRELAWIDQNIVDDKGKAAAENWRRQAIAITRKAG